MPSFPRGTLLRGTFLAGLLAGLLGLTSASDLAAQRRPGGGGRRAQVTVLKVGTVHPVSGPAIENGVIVIRGSRIVAVGSADEIEVPEGANVIEHLEAHAYPGLVDPLSAAFADPEAVSAGRTDAGTPVADALDPFEERSRELAARGITTAYVSNRSDSPWRGLGALIRPGSDGFRDFPEKTEVAVQMRISAGGGRAHPLQRLQALENVGNEFEQLEAYEKAFEKAEEELKKYEEDFGKYLEWHRARKKDDGDAAKEEDKKDGEQASGEGEAKPEGETPEARPEGGRRGRGRRPPGEGGGGGTPPAGGGEGGRPEGGAQDPQRAGGGGRGGEGAATGGDAKAKGEEKAPERPKYPKTPDRDPSKDALIKVRDGDLALFIEAQQTDEVERALALLGEHGIGRAAIEIATGAHRAAPALRDAGIPVIVLDAAPAGENENVDRDGQDRSVAGVMAKAGVPVAFGSGSVARARHLPSIAAEAVAYGMDEDAAVRAITLTPAEILGVADRVGSLEAGKLADIVLTSAPILHSDARILSVLASGRPVGGSDSEDR